MNSNAYTVILLDSLDTPIVDQMYAHEQVLEYMKHVPAGTPIAIFDLDTRMRLVQGFTTDPQMLLDAVKSKRSNPRLESIPGYLPRLRYEVLRDGMQTLGRYLAGFPGRKNLIWFTSFTNETLGGSGSNNAFHDSSSFVDDMTGTTDVLTLSRVAVYPIDPRGVSLHSTAFSDEYLDDFARRTGGRAFYSDNDLKGAVAEVVNTGSNYYTISYTPSNRNWNGERRKIELQVSGAGVGPRTTLQYRRSYVARSRQATELRHLAALKKKTSQGKFMTASESQPNGQQGVLLARGPQETLQRSMSLGSIAPTEIVFGASLKPAPTVEKLQKNAPPPPDNYMRPEFAKKPFRNYDILYAVNARQLQLTPTPDGLWHDSVEYVAVVYDDAGNVVNSLITTVQMNVKDATYRRMMANGFGMTQQIAVPTKGNYFLRVGVHDVDGDRVGALEIPMDEVKLGVAGAGQMLTP
jgi:VWFA-related protein